MLQRLSPNSEDVERSVEASPLVCAGDGCSGRVDVGSCERAGALVPTTGEPVSVASFVDLCKLPAGSRAEIVKVDGTPNGVARLRELGFQSGRRIEMVRPGATCIVKLDQCKMCVRPCGACVLVRQL
jgi:ferrous iron transport protein A